MRLSWIRFSIACLLLSGCNTISGTDALSNINAIRPGETYIVYEVPRGKRVLAPTFCPALDGEDYRFPKLKQHDQLCWFNDLDKAAKLTSTQAIFMGLMLEGDFVNSRLEIESSNPKFGRFYFVKIGKSRTGSYFPAYFAIGNKLAPLSGKVPIYNIEPGKINYIGQFPGSSGKVAGWLPEDVAEELRANGVSAADQNYSFAPPKSGQITCRTEPYGLLQTKTKICSLQVSEEPYFSGDSTDRS